MRRGFALQCFSLILCYYHGTCDFIHSNVKLMQEHVRRMNSVAQWGITDPASQDVMDRKIVLMALMRRIVPH